MSGSVVSLSEARRRRSLQPRDRLRAQAEVRGNMVAILARDRDALYTPAAAETFARGLLTLAASARGAGPTSELGEAELRARLALLGDAVARFDSGETASLSGMSTIVALVRQLTVEVRR